MKRHEFASGKKVKKKKVRNTTPYKTYQLHAGEAAAFYNENLEMTEYRTQRYSLIYPEIKLPEKEIVAFWDYQKQLLMNMVMEDRPMSANYLLVRIPMELTPSYDGGAVLWIDCGWAQIDEESNFDREVA